MLYTVTMVPLLQRHSYTASMQLALWVAMVSIVFQQFDDFMMPHFTLNFLTIAGMGVAVVMYWIPTLRYLSVAAFMAALAVSFGKDWYAAANHTWLAVWTLVPVVLFARWWEEEWYLHYIRLTLGVVMIAAALQKIIAGTYFDGSYIAWMNNYGSTTETMFSFLCAPGEVCGWYALLGATSVIWQFVVGLFLLAGWKNLYILTVEVAFLLTVGLFADEMNFQVLNIALLCMAFRFGMPHWLAYICLVFLGLDLIGISDLVATYL